MTDTELSLLRKIYSDILLGYTSTFYNKDKVLIKHFTSIDQSILDEYYLSYYEDALAKGLLNKEARLKVIIGQELWFEKDETWIANQKLYIDSLKETKSKVNWTSQIEQISKDIQEAQDQLDKKEQEKDALIGLTAESFASRKLNENYIFHAFRKENLNEHYFVKADFEESSQEELNELTKLYNSVLAPFTSKNLKKIGLSSFMQSAYSICDENPYFFYGVPVTKLTYYQIEIFQLARLFKHILSSEIKPTKEQMEDPDSVLDVYTSAQNSVSIVGPVSADDTSKTMIFGAKKSDIVAAGGRVAESAVGKAIKQKRGLSMDEIIKLEK